MKEWLQEQMEESLGSIKDAVQISSFVDTAIDATSDSLSTLREMDTVLKEIDKSVDSITKADFSNISQQAFESAGAYGKSVMDYLSSFQEMSMEGYSNAAQLADLSLMAQTATGMTEELTNQFIIAADQAYEMSGNIREITHALDGVNSIAHENSLSMDELASGVQQVSETAAQCGLKINETTAALATMMVSADLSDTDAAAAFEDIFTTLQAFSSGSDLADTASMEKLIAICDALGISIQSLSQNGKDMSNPIDMLSSLANAYQSLDPSQIGDFQLAGVFENPDTGQAFQAMLANWDMYEKLLFQYQAGIGNLQSDAAQNLDTWEGSLNQLSNTWTSTLSTLSNSDQIIGLIHVLNEFLTIVNKLTAGLGPLGTAGLAVGGILGAKNIGKTHLKNGFHFAYMPVIPSIIQIA